MNTVISNTFEPGDRVYDKRQKSIPGEEANQLIVLDTHDTRAENFTINEDGSTLADLVDDWPPSRVSVDLPEDYNPDTDSVVEVVFIESLDHTFLGAWVEWSPDKINRLCSINDVPTYSYHAQRLTEIDDR